MSKGRRNSNHSDRFSRRASALSDFGGPITKSCYTSFMYEPSGGEPELEHGSLDYGSNGQTAPAAAHNQQKRRNSRQPKERLVESLDQADSCYNCSNLEEFCMSSPIKDVIFDERRVVRSPEGKSFPKRFRPH